MENDEVLTQAQRHLREINGISNSPALVAVVQHEETTDATVLLLNNQVLNDGDNVEYNGKQFPVHFAIENMGTVPDVPNMEAPWQFISIDRWDPIHKTIVSYTTPYWGPGIPEQHLTGIPAGRQVHVDTDEEGHTTTTFVDVPGELDVVIPAIPSTMKAGSTVVGAVVHLTIGGIPIAPDNKGLGSHVLCEDLVLDRFAFTVPNTVWGFKDSTPGKRRADDQD